MVENNYGPRGISPALKVKVALLCLTVCDPHGQSMEFSRPKYCSGYFPFPSPGDLPKPQEWKQDLPHCRQILYQLSHKGSPSLALCICVCVCVKVAQLCLTLCDPMVYTVHRIHQARILEWVFLFSRGSFQHRY